MPKHHKINYQGKTLNAKEVAELLNFSVEKVRRIIKK